jgi:uroporphyrinogen III methyltransferase / synthase
MAGMVYLVGAGPGDPELLTLKGRRVLATADAVLYDHLANEALLMHAPATAERVYVGKKKADHAYAQAAIEHELINRARRGQRVVRLKGGDPFLFGRGGEEAEALHEAGIPFEVVPGVTAPLGIGAYCGVPLTHRDHTSVVTFLTGHNPDVIDWAKVSGMETVVIYMGLTHAGEIARRMIANGRDPQTPAMAVRWATRPEQEVVMAPLAELAGRVASIGMKPPATIVVGAVAGLRDRIGSWYEKLPLFGQRIVVTRAGRQAEGLAQRLREFGAEPILAPVIETVQGDTSALDCAIAQLESYDWLLFTSENGVRFFVERLDQSPRDWRALRAKVCAIGPATRGAVERFHLKVDLMPGQYVAESVVAALAALGISGKRVLLPRAAVARDVIPAELAKLGATVDVVEAYRTVIPAGAERTVALALQSRPHWITFTSSSTVKNFMELAAGHHLGNTRVASIGPVTSQSARECGLTVSAEATTYTTDGLLTALLAQTLAGRGI